ncbi:nicotinate-nucleotide pyrophosphorylase [Capsaspora owczarzaki ATCC 30864]|uniref:Nicotinate-nucleotide pyrophosphorylase [carboxylating] n=2 Tax=Capsaspora owczarzaki (strain ATCC 30864) TaxID=595528 RepID=A0A0D2UB67_CAPO3|nr:nicotinate-nucleotide pyrophosphorylase [Capsaspora owczarzaki ATCC 30864]
MTDFAHLLPPSWKTTVTQWLDEDIPSFDYGGFVVGEKEETAELLGKSPGVLAGVPFFEEVFRQVDCKVHWLVKEGDFVDGKRVRVATVTGKARNILLGERAALNMLARASGIASRARELRKLKDEKGFKGVVAGTRKTTPGFRLVEKYAMLVGGVDTHRMDLSSMIMLKDNHVWSQGSITNAVRRAKTVGGFALKIEVECRSIDEAREAITAGADIVMLDNFDPEALKVAARILKQESPHVLIEGSGGITSETLASYFDDAVDVLSMGSLTQGVPHVDFSLKIVVPK